MSLHDLKDKWVEHHRQSKQQRDLYRAIASAPTPASRQELMSLRLR